MRLPKEHRLTWGAGALFALFLAVSPLTGYGPGKAVGANFLAFSLQMLKVLPCVFILIGLFDVWVKEATVARHLGHGAGVVSYLWAVLLAGTTVGGLHVSIPIAHALYAKRARLGVIIAFLSACGVCRVPMTLFEASFLGWRFTCVRFVVSLPLILLASAMLGTWLDRLQYRLPPGDGAVAVTNGGPLNQGDNKSKRRGE